MRRSYLRDSAPGDLVEDVFVLTNKQLSATSTGKYFVKAFLSDRSAQVTARIWNATREMFNALPDSGFVRVRGRVENYQNNLQFIIEQFWPAKDGSFDISDLLPHTTKDIDSMCQRLFALCGSIKNRHLSAIIQAYLDDEDLMNNFAKAPAAMSFHHAFVGGLLEHTLNAMDVADSMCKFYPGLNRDLVVAGIFLHDIAKTWELCYDCAFGYTDGGQLVGHIAKGAMWIDQKAKAAEKQLGEPVPQALINVLQHIVLSHHGEAEFGSPKTPMTPEAIAVHEIENLDAKLMMSLEATRTDRGGMAGDGNWTEYMKAFNTRLYRPDVAGPDDAQPKAPVEAAGGAPAWTSKPQPVAATSTATTTEAPAPNVQAANGSSSKLPAPASPTTNPPRENVPHHREHHANQPNGAGNGAGHGQPTAAPVPPGGKMAINNPLFETTPGRKK